MKRFAASLVVVALVALGGAMWWRPPADSSSVAAWVQAIGSITAIATSIGLVGWQAHRDRLAEVDRARAVAARHLRATMHIVGSLAGIAGKIAEGGFEVTPRDIAASLAYATPLNDALRAGDHTQMPTRESLVAVLRAMGAGQQLLDEIASLELMR